MRRVLVSVVLLAFAGAAFAQKNNNQPNAARTADLEALSAVVSDLAARVNRLEATAPTNGTVAGTYSLAGLEVEVGRGCDACNPDITHHGTQTGTMVLNSNMSFTINGGTQAANFRLGLTPGAQLVGQATLGGGPFTAIGTWNVVGKIVTLIPAGESPKTFLIAGPNLLVGVMRSDDGFDHSLLLAVRQ